MLIDAKEEHNIRARSVRALAKPHIVSLGTRSAARSERTGPTNIKTGPVYVLDTRNVKPISPREAAESPKFEHLNESQRSRALVIIHHHRCVVFALSHCCTGTAGTWAQPCEGLTGNTAQAAAAAVTCNAAGKYMAQPSPCTKPAQQPVNRRAVKAAPDARRRRWQ